ncbi:histidine phosphatase family protein [Paenibacillus macerans]|uniref:histidine phosphatase family protein n=1 Tax=Paenibacillus macerans TaxID=44252 RepID=UPI003D3121AB
MSIEWWLVRHGITAWNAERRYQGHSDPPLLADEASGLAELRRELAGISFAAVYTSDLRRCRETLAIARPDLVDRARLDLRLREMNFGVWEGQTYDMLKDNALYRAWIDDPQTVTPPGGESWREFENRVTELCGELRARSSSLAARDRDVREGSGEPGDEAGWAGIETRAPEQRAQTVRLLIVTHGGVISMLSSLLQPGLGFWDTRVGPGGVLRLYI